MKLLDDILHWWVAVCGGYCVCYLILLIHAVEIPFIANLLLFIFLGLEIILFIIDLGLTLIRGKRGGKNE
jgi:hypothetical protein